MKEIESVYRIIHDETYNNQVLLDIELSKINDEKLVVGMLCDLYSKEGYKADKHLGWYSYNKLRKMFIKEFPDKHLHNPHTD